MKREKTRNGTCCADGVWRKIKNNVNVNLTTGGSCHLEHGKFLDYFRDGVDDLGIREQAVGDGCDNVKGTLQELPRVRAIQLPGAEYSLDAVP